MRMGTIFGKKGKNPGARADPNHVRSGNGERAKVTDKDRAILELKNVRDKLKRFRQKLEKDSEKLESQARELIAMKQKNRALLVLKIKKCKQKELEGLDLKLMNILTTIDQIEWASINMQVVTAIEAGTKELNRIHQEMPLDDVEALMEESNQAIEVSLVIIPILFCIEGCCYVMMSFFSC